MKIVFVFGTRPEITKTIGIAANLARRRNGGVSAWMTGQQTDLVQETVENYPGFLDLECRWIGAVENDRTDPNWRAKLDSAVEKAQSLEGLELLVGTGDTHSVLQTAKSASRCGAAFLHLEAGIRHNRAVDLEPEEKNRRAISPLATHHFCPSAMQRTTLIREGVDEGRILVAGDLSQVSIAETWRNFTTQGNFGGKSVVAKQFEVSRKLCICTFHRSTSLANLSALTIAVSELVGLHPDVKFLFCVRPDTRWASFFETIARSGNVVLMDAPPPLDFQSLLAVSDMVLTDSAGVQQEAEHFVKPCVALRENFELGEEAPLLYKVRPPFFHLAQSFLVAKIAAMNWKVTNLSAVRREGDAAIVRLSQMIENVAVGRGSIDRRKPE